ncbi:MAG: DUF456 domain-containing protein [Planctomycetes bacterium]|nr:DUF456 domain-containing protein [Planctomycetota bacterium]
MDYFLLITAILLLLIAIGVGWALTLMGLPGNWLMVAAAALYAWLTPTTGPTQITWITLLVMTVLAFGGELAELAAGVWGARRAGGSRRAAIFSLVGSMAGALLGASLGLPIPLIGPPVAALLGGALGALAGAAFAEQSRGETSRHSLRVGIAAFLGRLLGTGAKTFVATILAVIAIVALIL